MTVESWGILGIFIVQAGQTFRTWLVNRKVYNQNKKLNIDILALYKKLEIIDARTEHISFIPAFEIEMDSHINNALAGFSFEDKKVKSLTLSIAAKSKDIFVNILKIGFRKYDTNSLIANFDMQEMKLTGIVESHKLNIDKRKLFEIIKIERESFFIKINDIINNTSNGERQEAFAVLCQNYIFQIIKEISNL